MLNNYRKKIAEALEHQKQTEVPNLSWLIAGMSVFTFIYCILSVYLVPEGKPPAFNFLENGSITSLSAVNLSLGCGFALGSFLLHYRVQGAHRLLWLVTALGFGYLAFDELLQFHERGDRLVLEKVVSTSTFQNWNDMIVVAYGVVALPVLALMLPQLLRYRKVLGLFVTAFVFYFIHTAIDTVQTEQTLMTDIFEESAKLFSVTFLALGSFLGFIANIWQFTAAAAAVSGEIKTEPRRLATNAVEHSVELSPTARVV